MPVTPRTRRFGEFPRRPDDIIKKQLHRPTVVLRFLPLGVEKAELTEWVAKRVSRPIGCYIVEAKNGRNSYAFVRFETLQQAVSASCALDQGSFGGNSLRCELTHELRDELRYSKEKFSVDERKCAITARKTMTAFLDEWSCGDFESYQDLVKHLAASSVDPGKKYTTCQPSAPSEAVPFQLPSYMARLPSCSSDTTASSPVQTEALPSQALDTGVRRGSVNGAPNAPNKADLAEAQPVISGKRPTTRKSVTATSLEQDPDVRKLSSTGLQARRESDISSGVSSGSEAGRKLTPTSNGDTVPPATAQDQRPSQPRARHVLLRRLPQSGNTSRTSNGTTSPASKPVEPSTATTNGAVGLPKRAEESQSSNAGGRRSAPSASNIMPRAVSVAQQSPGTMASSGSSMSTHSGVVTSVQSHSAHSLNGHMVKPTVRHLQSPRRSVADAADGAVLFQNGQLMFDGRAVDLDDPLTCLSVGGDGLSACDRSQQWTIVSMFHKEMLHHCSHLEEQINAESSRGHPPSGGRASIHVQKLVMFAEQKLAMEKAAQREESDRLSQLYREAASQLAGDAAAIQELEQDCQFEDMCAQAKLSCHQAVVLHHRLQ